MARLTAAQRALMYRLGNGAMSLSAVGREPGHYEAAQELVSMRPNLVSIKKGQSGFLFASITPAGRSALAEEE